jgi:hypothetical protein
MSRPAPPEENPKMVNVSMSYDYAVHSDFLVHWSGKDIDADRQRMWEDGNHRSETDPDVDDRYLCRLRDILTYGLWMTDEGERRFGVGPKEITIPSISKCCFTELKLSESRRHAVRYGRLGIGVKRPFVFQRLGRPMAYFGFGEQSNADRFLAACSQELRDPTLLNFFKPMNSDSSRLTYELSQNRNGGSCFSTRCFGQERSLTLETKATRKNTPTLTH